MKSKKLAKHIVINTKLLVTPQTAALVVRGARGELVSRMGIRKLAERDLIPHVYVDGRLFIVLSDEQFNLLANKSKS